MNDPIHDLASAGPPAAPPMSPALEAELAALAPVRARRPIRQLVVLIACSLVYGAGMVALLAIRRDADELPRTWLVGAALAWLLGFVLPVYLAIVPRRASMAPRRQFAALASLVASIGFVALGMLIHPSGPSSAQLGVARFAVGHVCLELGLATAIVPIVIGALLLRGTIPVGSRWIAAALGAGSGSLGGLVLHLHCHVTDPLHAGVMHGGVVVVAAIVSALVVPRAIELR